VRLQPEGGDGLSGTVVDLAFRGAGYSYRVDVPGLGEPVKADMAAELGRPFAVGSRVGVSWDPASCGLLRREAKPG
jgi:hypothetical protein